MWLECSVSSVTPMYVDTDVILRGLSRKHLSTVKKKNKKKEKKRGLQSSKTKDLSGRNSNVMCSGCEGLTYLWRGEEGVAGPRYRQVVVTSSRELKHQGAQVRGRYCLRFFLCIFNYWLWNNQNSPVNPENWVISTHCDAFTDRHFSSSPV